MLYYRLCDTMFVMEKTRELYYEDAYMREFDATVVSCEEREGGDFFVVLDRSAFFPEQGGQSSDTGTLGSDDGKRAIVLHASIRDGVIRHRVDVPLEVGTQVHGIIDFGHRFSNMQQHTGEHIFSGIVNSRFGFDNVGFHLSDSEVTMDYNGVLTREDIRQVEMLANEAVWSDLEVRCEFPDGDVLSSLEYRSKKELLGDIRIVTIPGVDICACCAPHVRRTGEIGLLKVISCQNYKGGVRVSILCGKRALEYMQGEHDIVRELTKLLTTGQDKIIESVKRTAQECSDLKGQLAASNEKLIEAEIASIDPDKSDVFLVKDKGFDGNLMRKTVNLLAATHSGLCGIFAGSDDEGYRYIIASGSEGRDAAGLQGILRSEFGAKGGGNAKMIQGSIPACSVKDILEYCMRK